MSYKVSPLLYGASENLMNTIRFTVELKEKVEETALRNAVETGMKRYPYLAVRLQKEEEAYVLAENDLPFVISQDGHAVCLASEESNWHLVAFSFEDRNLNIDISHFLVDGTGLVPLVKTITYYYLTNVYGEEGIDSSKIRLAGSEIPSEESGYPFPSSPIPMDQKPFPEKPASKNCLELDPDQYDQGGAYAYHIRLKQKDLMKRAKTIEGSPNSYLAANLYKAFCNLYPDLDKDVVCAVSHQFRKALGNPLSHDSLAKVFYFNYTKRMKDWDIDRLNLATRGAVILGCDESSDLKKINEWVQLDTYLAQMPLERKIQTMHGAISKNIVPDTFSISYTGQIDWAGMEQYIEDVHAYAGEKKRTNSISLQIFTIGEYFSITFLQKGKGDYYVNAFVNSLVSQGIPCEIKGGAYYNLCDFYLKDSFEKQGEK